MSFYRRFLTLTFVLTTAFLTVSTASAQVDESEASLELLDFPILFSKQHNYQGLHIYDT